MAFAGGFLTGDGWIDSDLLMNRDTQIYLASTNNFTVSSINMRENALLFIVLFDRANHGVSLTIAKIGLAQVYSVC